MLYATICFISIGAIIGFMFTLFLINFDGKWKLLLETLFGIGGSGLSIYTLCDFFMIYDQKLKFITTTSYIFGFFISTIVSLMVMCRLIKDKDDNDILRIRDILLGEKSYIKTYYKKRKSEIENKLPLLEERERKIEQAEKALENERKYLDTELDKLSQLGTKKLKFVLPDKKSIYLNKEFVDSLPSYISDLSKCISDIKDHTYMFSEKNIISKNDLTSYFLSVALFIAQDLFGGKSREVRIHFRLYNEQSQYYEKLIAIVGSEILSKDMTPIPFGNSMIQRSFECKRALIKSINSDFDYQSNNYTVWKDYMTYTFYNLKRNDEPYLTFGISVKNEVRFKTLFYFLNYFKIEQYLEEYVELIDEKFNIENVLYN